jgi:hypothetical protein
MSKKKTSSEPGCGWIFLMAIPVGIIHNVVEDTRTQFIISTIVISPFLLVFLIKLYSSPETSSKKSTTPSQIPTPKSVIEKGHLATNSLQGEPNRTIVTALDIVMMNYATLHPEMAWVMEHPTMDQSTKEMLFMQYLKDKAKKGKNNNYPPGINGVVYLLQAGQYFKIGKSKDFNSRIKQIKLQLPKSIGINGLSIKEQTGSGFN